MPLLESKDVRVQGGAAAALANLATKRPEMAIQIVHEGGVEPLVPLLRSEVGQVQQCAIGCVGNLIRDPENAMNVAQQDGLIPALSQALVRSDDPQTIHVAGNALANFASHSEIRPVLREDRLHIALVEAVKKHQHPQLLQPVGRAFAAMALDAEAQVLIVQAGGLPEVLQLLRCPDPQVKEFATMALINIAANTENADAVLADSQAQAALSHLAQTRTDQFQKMAQGVIDKLKAAKNSVVGDDVE